VSEKSPLVRCFSWIELHAVPTNQSVYCFIYTSKEVVFWLQKFEVTEIIGESSLKLSYKLVHRGLVPVVPSAEGIDSTDD